MEYFIAIFALFVLVIIPLTIRQRKIAAARLVLNRTKHNKENLNMKELAKQFIGKDCIVYTITSYDASIQGTIKEIVDGGMIIEKNSGEKEIINLDFVTRIREYPRKKNGKKKSIVLGWTLADHGQLSRYNALHKTAILA